MENTTLIERLKDAQTRAIEAVNSISAIIAEIGPNPGRQQPVLNVAPKVIPEVQQEPDYGNMNSCAPTPKRQPVTQPNQPYPHYNLPRQEDHISKPETVKPLPDMPALARGNVRVTFNSVDSRAPIVEKNGRNGPYKVSYWTRFVVTDEFGNDFNMQFATWKIREYNNNVFDIKGEFVKESTILGEYVEQRQIDFLTKCEGY